MMQDTPPDLPTANAQPLTPRVDFNQPSSTGCLICSKQTPLRACSICGAGLYCSPECQKQDWKVHKILCATWKDFQHPPEDSPNVRRVLMFDIDQPTLRFAWMPVEPRGTGEHVWDYPRPAQLYPPGTVKNMTLTITAYNAARTRQLIPSLQIHFQDSFQRDDSVPVNMGVLKCLPPRNAGELTWKGPLVVSKILPRPERILHADLRDLREIADWMVEWRRGRA